MKRAEYKMLLGPLHIELLKMQRWVVSSGARVLAIFEGRDAAGKGGVIKRLIKHLNPRGYRVVALAKPSDQERSQWYFQRYVAHLSSAGEIALFDRSWYNRAGIERVMNFCSPEECEEFLNAVPNLEAMLVRSGLLLFKFYFSITRQEQARRIEKRRRNPLKQWKLTPLDLKAQENWDAYSRAEEEMFRRTSTAQAPWILVDGDDKRWARINAIRYLLSRLDYPDKDSSLLEIDSKTLRPVDTGMSG